MATHGYGEGGILHSPRPPDDPELRNIIDKLANFVARNGPEFEQMTMEKQRDNPKFFFLFGGESNVYYKWKVATEQAAFQSQSSTPNILPLMSQHQSLANSSQYAQPSYQQPPSSVPPQWSQNPLPMGLFARLEQARLHEQSSLQQLGLTDPLEVEFTTVVSPVMESCTKEAISAGKAWIFNHSRTREECNQVASFIARKTLTSTGIGFTHKLHIIYLINDVMHHCLRKGAQELKQAIEDVIVQTFYNVHINDPDKSESLMKVLKIWESQKYFSDLSLQQIRTVLTEDPKAHSNTNSSGTGVLDQGHSGNGSVLPPWQQQQSQQQPLMPSQMMPPPSLLPPPGVYNNQSLPPPLPLPPLPPLGPPPSQGLQLPSQSVPSGPPPLMQSAPPPSMPPAAPQQGSAVAPSGQQQSLPPWQQQQQSLPPVAWQQQQQQQAFNPPILPPPWTSNMVQQPLPSSQQQQLPPPPQQTHMSPWQPLSQPRPLFAPDDPLMLKSRPGEAHRDHEAQAEGGMDPLMPFKEGGRLQERPFGEGRGGDSMRPFGEGVRSYGEGRLPPPPAEGMRPYEDNRGPEGGLRLYGDVRPPPEDMRPYGGDGRHPEYEDWSSEGMGPYDGDGRPLEGVGPYDECEPRYRESGPYGDEGRIPYRDENMQHYEDWGLDERGRHYGDEQEEADSRRPFDRDHPEGDMDMDMPPHLGPGEKQIFDYQHQSHPDPFRGRRDVYDYNHHPPSNNWDLPPPPSHMGPPPSHMGPPPPHMGPPPPFCDPHWLPPPHPLPPDCPPIPPPDMPPPIPYFDLPAGVMVMLVPLHEHSYKSLHPGDVRLPPPQPPSERLMQAVEEFYDQPTEDKPRNEEGWEARALLDFFSAKVKAKEAFESRFRAQVAVPRRPVQPKRPHRTRSKSRSRSHSRSHSYSDSDSRDSRSRSRSYSRSRSRSRSHSRKNNHSSRSPSSSSSRSKSRSPKKKRSRRSRSRSRSPFIPTVDAPLKKAPDGSQLPVGENTNVEQKLGEDNVGHQLLKKMGWEGTGLGTKQQGIQEPIKGGEVRDKQNKYKGIGANMNDPFETYRKTKSYTFNRRPTGTENV